MQFAPTSGTPAITGDRLRLHRRECLLGAAGVLLGVRVCAAEDDAVTVRKIDVAGARIELQLGAGFDAALADELAGWAVRSAQAVAGYLGRFPQRALDLQVEPVGGAGVRSGKTFADPAPWLRLRVGRRSTRADLLDDWILVHEMIHLAVPQLARAHNWLHEGLATYVEGVVRGRAGLLPAAEVWQGWARAMPQGLPAAGDHGLDHTPTWGRTYWGGAIFCLLADLRIHERSEGRLGLQHALRGLLAAGGGYHVAWPVERVLAACDAAIGQDTMGALYARMKDRPEPVDLPALWRALGVAADRLRDDAPLAAIRRAILS